MQDLTALHQHFDISEHVLKTSTGYLYRILSYASVGSADMMKGREPSNAYVLKQTDH